MPLPSAWVALRLTAYFPRFGTLVKLMAFTGCCEDMALEASAKSSVMSPSWSSSIIVKALPYVSGVAPESWSLAMRPLTSVKMLGTVTSRLSLPAFSSSLLTVIGPGDV